MHRVRWPGPAPVRRNPCALGRMIGPENRSGVVQSVYGCPDRRRYARLAGGTSHDDAEVFRRLLCEGIVELWHRPAPERERVDRVNDPTIVRGSPPMDIVSPSGLPRPVALRHLVADYRDGGSAHPIPLIEVASANERESHGSKVAWRDRLEIGEKILQFRRRNGRAADLCWDHE